MEKRKVISSKNLLTRSPLLASIVCLALDILGAPGWAWGVLGTLLAILWLAFIADLWMRDDVDVL